MAPWPNIQKHQIKSKVVVYTGLAVLVIGVTCLLASNIYQSRESSALYSRNPGSVEDSPFATTSKTVGAPLPKTTLATSTPTITPIREAKTLTDIAWFYPELSWQTQSTVAPGELSWAVTYGGKKVLLRWQAWTAKKYGLALQDYTSLDLKFHKYYETTLAAAGWVNSPGIIINGERLLPNEAAGARGMEWSYLGIKEGNFRVILLQQKDDSIYRVSPSATPTDEPGGESYTVFLSDITPIAQLPVLLQATR
jgi:hypothetical protein